MVSLGIGYEGPLFSIWSNEKISELSFDLYVQYIMGGAQQSVLPGAGLVYDSDYLVIGIGAGLNILYNGDSAKIGGPQLKSYKHPGMYFDRKSTICIKKSFHGY